MKRAEKYIFFVFIFFVWASAGCGSLCAQFFLDIKWIRVEGGEFEMGCKQANADCYPDETAHRVSVSTFEIAAYEVTVAQYRTYCEKTGKTMPKEPPFGWQDEHPIVNITWKEAQDFATWAGARLPSEAEWEYAARGGRLSRGYLYSGSNNPDEVGWSYENSVQTTHPVGRKKPNELGIYDMSGNAWEWCNDNYATDYYNHSPKFNPQGPDKGQGKCNRGGCFNFDCKVMKVSHRRGSGEESIGVGTGFRLARDVKKRK